MKKLLSCLLAILSLLAMASSCTNIASQNEDKETSERSQHPDIVQLTNPPSNTDANVSMDTDKYSALVDFCNDIAASLAAESDGSTNTLSSPLSAYFALAMVKAGASGKTLDEMNAVMGDISDVKICSLISHLTTLNHTTLNIADSVWIDNTKNFEPKQKYLDTLAEYYLAECYKAELAVSEGAVNRWIEEHTNGMIKNMLNETALDSALMALVNTIYMDAQWKKPFDSYATHEREFVNSDGSRALRDFMYNGNRSEAVIESDSYIGVVLPYKDGSLKFAALMSKDDTMSAAAMFELIAEDGGWKAIAETAEDEKIKLYIPSFEQDDALSLNDTLKALGIELAFSDGADFSEISNNIKLDSVLQNAVLKLDENGTEAAAATVATMVATSARPVEEVRTIEFNRPFAFGVFDSDTGAVLFTGEHNIAE